MRRIARGKRDVPQAETVEVTMKVIPAALMLVFIVRAYPYSATTVYFPLAVGNVWEYEVWYDYDGMDYYNDAYAMRTVTVCNKKQCGDSTYYFLIDSTVHDSSITITGYPDSSGVFYPETTEKTVFRDSLNIYRDTLLSVNDTIFPMTGPSSVFTKLPYYLKNYNINELPFGGKFVGDTINLSYGRMYADIVFGPINDLVVVDHIGIAYSYSFSQIQSGYFNTYLRLKSFTANGYTVYTTNTISAPRNKNPGYFSFTVTPRSILLHNRLSESLKINLYCLNGARLYNGTTSAASECIPINNFRDGIFILNIEGRSGKKSHVIHRRGW